MVDTKTIPSLAFFKFFNITVVWAWNFFVWKISELLYGDCKIGTSPLLILMSIISDFLITSVLKIFHPSLRQKMNYCLLSQPWNCYLLIFHLPLSTKNNSVYSYPASAWKKQHPDTDNLPIIHYKIACAAPFLTYFIVSLATYSYPSNFPTTSPQMILTITQTLFLSRYCLKWSVLWWLLYEITQKKAW